MAKQGLRHAKIEPQRGIKTCQLGEPSTQAFKRRGEGTTPFYLRPQNTLFTTENPLDFNGEKNQTLKQIKPNNGSTKRAKQGLRGGGRPPTPKQP